MEPKLYYLILKNSAPKFLNIRPINKLCRYFNVKALYLGFFVFNLSA